MYVVFLTSFIVWVACDTFPQTATAQSAPRTPVSSRSDSRQVELANLRADVKVLDRRMREMSLAMEDLTERNRRLSNKVEKLKKQNSELAGTVSQDQLDRAVDNLRQRMKSANTEQRRQIIREVTQQIDALGEQTQAAIDAVANNSSRRSSSSSSSSSSSQTSFSEDFPKEGISYTVRSGDTLSAIASRHDSTVRDIQNANQIANPGAIQVGQTLFIPQRNN